MKVNELQIGDFITDGSQFPMYVAGIFSDCVYLDFEGNEGDVLEVAESDLEPIPLTPEILEKNGFKGREFFGELDTKDYLIQCDCYNIRIKAWGKDLIDVPCDSVHELQHILRLAKIDLEIKLK